MNVKVWPHTWAAEGHHPGDVTVMMRADTERSSAAIDTCVGRHTGNGAQVVAGSRRLQWRRERASVVATHRPLLGGGTPMIVFEPRDVAADQMTGHHGREVETPRRPAE